MEEDLRKAISRFVDKAHPHSKEKNRVIECIIAVDEDEKARDQYFEIERMRRSKLVGTYLR